MCARYRASDIVYGAVFFCFRGGGVCVCEVCVCVMIAGGRWMLFYYDRQRMSTRYRASDMCTVLYFFSSLFTSKVVYESVCA